MLDWELIDFLVGGLLAVGICPLIYDLIIIPKIEKRLNKKLEYKALFYQKVPTYSRSPLWLVKYHEICVYILAKHILLIFHIKNPKFLKFENFALDAANYNIKEASCFEIVFSYFTYFSISQAAIVLMHYWLTKT